MGWIDAGPAAQFDATGMFELDLARTAILLLKTPGGIFAVSAVCPHQSAWFSQGRLAGNRILCPRHSGAFGIATGQRLAGPQCADLPVFPTRIENGRIWVKLPS